MNLQNALGCLASRFDKRVPLSDDDRAALYAMPFEQRALNTGSYLVREGAVATVSTLILSGFAVRHKLTPDGDRQIVSIHIPGDFVDLEASLLAVADHNVQTVTRCQIGTVATSAMVDLIDRHPRLARAMWVDTLIEGSIYREWVMNIGRRPARERVAHILCEFARRLEVAGLGTTTGYLFPMTQEQLADCTGLTAVHVNRTLKQLDDQGLIRRYNRFIEIPDWERLREMSGFTETYLHIDQAA